MLGKLFKYEFKAFSRMMIPLLTVFLAFSVIIAAFTLNGVNIFNLVNETDVNAYTVFFLIIIPVYAISFCGIIGLTFINCIVRFNKSMFSNEGYLMRTIPVKISSFLTVQIMVAFIWFIISSLCLVLFICFFIVGQYNLSDESTTDIMLNALSKYFGEDLSDFIATFISRLINFLYIQLLLIISLTIASKSKNHKIACTIALAIFFNIFVSTVTGIIMALATKTLTSTSYIYTIIKTVFIIIFFILTCRIIENKSDIE